MLLICNQNLVLPLKSRYIYGSFSLILYIQRIAQLWPAIKLINNLTPKLTGLAINEINSIGTKISAKKKLVLAGKNKEKNSIPWFLKPIIFIATKIEKDKQKSMNFNKLKFRKNININRWLIVGLKREVF